MFPVKISDKAASEIKKVMEEQSLEDSALRIGLQGGGCSGFQYLLNFVKEEEVSEEEDYINQQGDIKVVVDKQSAAYLQGTVIDFYSGIDKRGFVFNNPNTAGDVTGGCGTGGCSTGENESFEC